MKKRIVTLGGMPGSGKSSTGKRLAELLGYTRTSSGDFFRELAAKRGMTVEEINSHAELEPELDHETDEWVRRKGEESDFVIDSRMAFHWIPEGFNVFLKLDPHTAAERTFAHISQEGRVSQSATSVEDTYQNMLGRIESERKRYGNLYSIDYTDESHYDLVVDTGPNDLETVSQIIAKAYREWLEQGE